MRIGHDVCVIGQFIRHETEEEVRKARASEGNVGICAAAETGKNRIGRGNARSKAENMHTDRTGTIPGIGLRGRHTDRPSHLYFCICGKKKEGTTGIVRKWGKLRHRRDPAEASIT